MFQIIRFNSLVASTVLVLLGTLVIAAPLLTQRVTVDLPVADAKQLSLDAEDSVVVSVNAKGEMFIDMGDGKTAQVEPEALQTRITALLKYKPKTNIMVQSDRSVDYGHVVQTMAMIQQAGASNVGLITETPEE